MEEEEREKERKRRTETCRNSRDEKLPVLQCVGISILANPVPAFQVVTVLQPLLGTIYKEL